MTLGDVIFTISGQDITLGQLLIIPTVLIVGYLAIRWLARIITKRLVARNIQPDIVHLIRRIFYVVALLVLAITTLDLLNVPLTTFAFVSGAIAIGVGFGAQNIINNFISGWILMWERPVRIGDYLEVGGANGTVEAINNRSTRIRRTDGAHMLIPNSALEFDVFLWINAAAERNLRVVRSDIRFRIVELFENDDLVIAFPQLDVHLDGNITLLNQPQAGR